MSVPPVILIILLIFVGSLVILIPGIILSRRHQRKVAKAWNAFAQKYEFTIDIQKLHAHGQKEDWPIDLRVETRGGGKDQHVVTIIRWDLDGLLPRGFEMELEEPGDKLRKLMGQKDDEIGEETFDKAFKLTNLIPEVKEILRNDLVRRSLLLVASIYHRFSIQGGEMHVEYWGVPSSVEALESMLSPILASVLALNHATGGTRPHRHTVTPPVIFQHVK